jgi:GNAT superfamily N-acetyltransferase
MTPELIELLKPFPDLQITQAEKALYRNFRYNEPNLVSCTDNFEGKQEEEVLVLLEKGQPLGVVSMVIQENLNKQTSRKSYARLDLVIVHKKYRNLGVGHLLMVCALVYILRSRGSEIYSISCLAAHKTVEKFLKELSFQDHPRKEKNYWQGTLDLEEESLRTLLDSYLEKAKTCLQWTAYQLQRSS